MCLGLVSADIECFERHAKVLPCWLVREYLRKEIYEIKG